ncbi:MAG: AraC family ligand binding domain-containing protein [Verrucomicrobia bacterium]|nr:AraC family ligand binding domain-containing protein [Verrucomicrobiota bacterium]
MPKPVKFERELVFLDRNFPLNIFILEDHPDYPQHVHDFSQIVIILHGRGINVVGKEEFPVKAGDVFVHHGGRPHGYRDTAASMSSARRSFRSRPATYLCITAVVPTATATRPISV